MRFQDRKLHNEINHRYNTLIDRGWRAPSQEDEGKTVLMIVLGKMGSFRGFFDKENNEYITFNTHQEIVPFLVKHERNDG